MLMKLEMEFTKFLSRIESGNLDVITEYLLQTPATSPKFVWTMNLSHFREVAADPEAFVFLNSDSLIVADGWPVKYLVKTFEARVVCRVPGVDIVDTLLANGVNFCVIGSDRGQVLKSLAKHEGSSSELTFIYDKLIDINSEIELEEIVQLLLEFKPQFIFLALGFPKQEFLYERIRTMNPAIRGYFLGIGGSFQMLSGEKIRAPLKLQKLGLEWMWRLSQDPKRLFARYYADGKFLSSLVIRRKSQRVRDILNKWARLN
jgi:N-acetylglucosaminyldiphosphoundecaprenol N-acetyl-beta-D-mannosaminyltransferase